MKFCKLCPIHNPRFAEDIIALSEYSTHEVMEAPNKEDFLLVTPEHPWKDSPTILPLFCNWKYGSQTSWHERRNAAITR